MRLISDEKNERSKLMIKKKVGEYLERAEKLKDHLSKPSAKDGGGKTAAANGVGSGGRAKSILRSANELIVDKMTTLMPTQQSYEEP